MRYKIQGRIILETEVEVNAMIMDNETNQIESPDEAFDNLVNSESVKQYVKDYDPMLLYNGAKTEVIAWTPIEGTSET